MTDDKGDSTMISSDNGTESPVKVDHLNNGQPLEPYEGMEFASIEDAKSYYTRYAKNKGFSFRMGRLTKSRTIVTLRDPPVVATKGRPRSLRIKSSVELKKGARTCSCCKKKGHDKRKCPGANQARMDA